MRLLYVHNGVFPQPVANRQQVVRMCEALAANGVDVTLLAFGEDRKDEGEEKERDVFRYYGVRTRFGTELLAPGGSYYRRSLRLFRAAQRLQGFDAVYTRDLLVARLLAGKGRDVVYELHDYPRNPAWRWLFRRTFARLRRLVVISAGLREDLGKDGYDPARIAVLPDGVDLERFDIRVSKEAARRRLRLPAGKRIALYAGTLLAWKGVGTLCEASRPLGREWLVVLVGARTPEEFALSRRYPRVRVLGYQDAERVALCYKAADILVLPNTGKEAISARYTSPLKLFEYLAARRPVVASDLPSIRSVVSEKEVTFFAPDDAADLGRKIAAAAGPERKKAASAGHALAKRHTWRARAATVAKLF